MYRKIKGYMSDTGGRVNKTQYIPLAALAASFVISAFLLFSHYSDTKEQLGREFAQERIITARDAAGRISSFLEHERSDLVNAGGAMALAGGPVKGRAVLELFFKTGVRPRKLFSYFALDDKGRFLYSVPDSLVDRYMQDLSGEGYFRDAVGRDGFYFTGARPDKKEGWEAVLSAPVPSQDGRRPAGLVAERMDIKALDQMFISRVDARGGGYALLVDDGGRVLAAQKGGMLYQVESSSLMLKRMMNGEEGSILMDSPESGEQQLAVFSPVSFAGHTWSLGIITPAAEINGLARTNIERTLFIFAMMILAFAWSLISVMRSGRYKAGIRERARASEMLIIRNRELSALNDLAVVLSGSEELGDMPARAIDMIRLDTGASGGAVSYYQPLAGEFLLKAECGMPDAFRDAPSCSGTPDKCRCWKVMTGGVPVRPGPEDADGIDGEGCRACLPGGFVLVPLTVNGKGVGILYLAGLDEEFSEERSKFLIAIGNQMAAGVERLMQIEDTSRHAAMTAALFNTAQALTKSLDLDDLLMIIMTEAASLLKVKRCLLMLYNEEDNRLDCRVGLGLDGPAVCKLSFGLSGVFWEAMVDGGVRVVDQAEKRQEVPKEFIGCFGLGPFVIVPLVSKGKALGFLVMDLQGGARAMQEDLKLIVGFANQAALAIETSSFYIRTVEKYNEDLRQLSTRIIDAQEEERKRISLDLHDELGQFLSAIKMDLDALMEKMPHGADHLTSRLTDASGLVMSALESVRRLSFELRPKMLDDLGLSMALGKLISGFRKRSGIEVEFVEEGPRDRLYAAAEVVLYRVVQEALTNITKHSMATKVVINLTKDANKRSIRLYVEDNGAGFTIQPDGQARHAKGFGLMGIKERVSLLGGNFRLSTEENKGVRLLVDIPWLRGEGDRWMSN